MQKLSTLADDLWPYLVGRVARVNGNGGGRVISIGDSGSATLAGLDDVDLGALSDGQLFAYEGSTGKWTNVDPAAGGGLTYTAGNGIAISGGNVISTRHKSGGGLFADSLGLYIVLNSESGLGLDSNGLRVGAGNGIDVQGDLTAVHLGAGSGLTFDGAGGLVVAATLAGPGLDLTAGVMSVNVTEGIEYVGDSIRVDEDYAFIWQASHRFNATPQLNANLNFIGADRTITSAAGIDVTIDLGQDLILASPMTFRSADYLDDIPIAGFSLFPNTGGDRQLTINTIKSDSLHTRLFVADGVRIDIGEERWGKSMGIVHDDFFVPTLVGNMVTVFFEDSPMLTGALFSAGDWVVFKYLNQGVNFAYGLVWGQVTSYVNRGLDADGRGYQSWGFTLRHGDAGVLIKKGNVAVDYGVAGQGYAFLSVLSDAVGPWFRIGTWSGANPYTAGNTQIRAQMGNLAGISDTALNPSGYGFYSDNVFLHGKLRTVESVLDDDGLTIQYAVTGTTSDPGGHALVAWRTNIDDRVGARAAEVAAWQYTGGTFDADLMSIRIAQSDSSSYSNLFLEAARSPGGSGGTGSYISIHTEGINLNPDYGNALVTVMGHIVPSELYDITFDLGTPTVRWRNLYVDHLYVTGAISGDVLSGQEWEYPGSMIIDAHGTGDLTVTITNQATGRADLVVDRNITLGGTIDGVDISAHVSDPSAHHALASAGDGIVVASGQIISVDATVVRTPATVLRTTQVLLTDTPLTGGGQLGDGLTLRLLLAAVDPGLTSATGGLAVLLAGGTPGLSLTGGLQVDSSVARTTTSMIAGLGLTGGGTLAATRTFDVGAGAGIVVNADDVGVDFTAVPHIATLMIAGAGMTGGGDLSANRTFDVIAGNGSLTVNADDMVVNQGYTFGWTGAQTWAAAATFNGVPTFNSAPQVNANLAFIGADRTLTGSGNLTMQPASNLTLDPTGGIVYLPDDVEERSSTFADLVTGINGFRLWTTGGTARQLTIGSIKADSFVTRTFVADTIRLEQGDSYWGKGYGIVNTDFVLPAVNADVNVWFDNVPNTAGNIFSVGDKLLARFIVWTAGVSVKLIWFNVQAFVSADDPNFRQRWTLRRLSGGVTGDTVIKGVAMEDAGATGQGWIHVTSLSGGPYMEFGTQTSVAGGIPQFTQNVRIGQLSGTVDYAASAWGFATGNNLGIGPTAGFSGITIDNSVQGLRVFNAAYQLFNGANLILSLEKTNGLSIEFGAAAFNSIGWYEDLGTGTPSGLMGSVGAARAISGYTELDLIATGIAGSYATGAVRLRGVNSSAAAYNLWLDSSGVYFGTGTTLVARPQTGGFITDAIQYFSGNVGIGTTGPSYMLDVKSTFAKATPSTQIIGVFGSSDASQQLQLRLGLIGSATAADRAGYIEAAESGLSTRNLVLQPTSGNVGIGIATPAYSFHLQSAFAKATEASQIVGVFGSSDTSQQLQVRLGLIGSATAGNRAGYLEIAESGVSTRNLVLQPTTGNVGIGVTTPAATLHIVEAGSNGEGLRVERNLVATSTDSPVAYIFQDNAADDQDALSIRQDSNTGYGLTVRQTALLGTAGTYPVARFAYSPDTYELGLKVIMSSGLARYSFGLLNNSTSYPDMLVFDRGNIGIGTISPQRALHIGGGGQSPSQPYGGFYCNPNETTVQMTVENLSGIEGGIFAHSGGNVYMGAWSNSPLILRTNFTDRVTITAAGAVTVAGTLDSNGVHNAVGGINFGQTANLTYYDGVYAGSVTVVVGGSATGLVFTGKRQWYRVGNVVVYFARVDFTNKGAGSGAFQFTGLPFASNANFIGVGNATFGSLSSSIVSLMPYINPGSTSVNFWYNTTAGGGPSQLQGAQLTNTSVIEFQITYFV